MIVIIFVYLVATLWVSQIEGVHSTCSGASEGEQLADDVGQGDHRLGSPLSIHHPSAVLPGVEDRADHLVEQRVGTELEVVLSTQTIRWCGGMACVSFVCVVCVHAPYRRD